MRYSQFFVLLLIFSGETLAICAEVWGAKLNQGSQFLRIFLQMFIVFAVGGALLIAGYMLGFKAFQNIWVLSAVSITSILIMEPLVAYLVFRQLPTFGSVVGLVFGALGLIATLVL